MTRPKAADIAWNEAGEPVSSQFEDTYYSKANGQAETDFVFIQNNQLPERWAMGDGLKIAELGFGTGLNFLETWRQWKMTRGQDVLTFESLEGFPLSKSEMAKALAAWDTLDKEATALLAALPDQWPHEGETLELMLDAQTKLIIHFGMAEDVIDQFADNQSAWFLDGFAPARNEGMWTERLMEKIHQKTALNGTFSTYTSAGWVRRNLEKAGFHVQKIRGYAGKRAMSIGQRRA